MSMEFLVIYVINQSMTRMNGRNGEIIFPCFAADLSVVVTDNLTLGIFLEFRKDSL